MFLPLLPLVALYSRVRSDFPALPMLHALFCKKEPDLSLLTEVLEVLVCSVGFSGVRFQVSTASGNQRHVAGDRVGKVDAPRTRAYVECHAEASVSSRNHDRK